MEIFGGFMAMFSILGFLLAVVWLLMPFVVFAIKGKQERTLELVEALEQRLLLIERKLDALQESRVSSQAIAPAAENGRMETE